MVSCVFRRHVSSHFECSPLTDQVLSRPPVLTYNCPLEFELVGKFCFTVGPEKLTQDEAQDYCVCLARTGKLVEIETELEMEMLKIYIAKKCLECKQTLFCQTAQYTLRNCAV